MYITCAYDSCPQRPYVENDGTIHPYCSREHANLDYQRYGKYATKPKKIQSETDTNSISDALHTIKKGVCDLGKSVISLFVYPTHQSTPKVIHFYNRGEPYYEFTNFYERPITVDGINWPTTEHYFQAMKFAHLPKTVEFIRTELTTARDVFSFTRNEFANQYRPVPPVREDWEKVKLEVMMNALWCKFTQHKDLRIMLLKTGDAKLVEHTEHDNFWADGGDGSGRNMLGEMLMKLRLHFRSNNINN